MKAITKLLAGLMVCTLGLFAVGCHSSSDDGVTLKSISLDSSNSTAMNAKILEAEYTKGCVCFFLRLFKL